MKKSCTAQKRGSSESEKTPLKDNLKASNVRVILGRNGINTISFMVNSSTIDSTIGNSSTLYPDEYLITEEAVIKNATAVALFSVSPRKTL